ncbi:MAG: excinuclease ABC subunit UvrB [Patescibacteria group bacterium]
MTDFKLKNPFTPAGDQPKAIKELCEGISKDNRYQTLFGVTGSGKTFTVANVIQQINKPTLVIAHNKTLAAQLAQEYKDFFPENAVHYFVSYYDYYQPEAYMHVTDTYIEKEAQINEEIDRLRHASTQALLTRKDVIIVASVSCIYGLGSPAEYKSVNLILKVGDTAKRIDLTRRLVEIRFERTNADLNPGNFRVIGNFLEIMPTNEKIVYRIELEDNKIRSIQILNYLSRSIIEEKEAITIFPGKHFITDKERLGVAIGRIKAELKEQLKYFTKEGKLLEADRLKRRTGYDLALLKEVGYCNGIENYSRHLSLRNAGDAPDTLLSYFPRDKDGKPGFLTVIDESHVTIPQIGGMYAGDASRKKNLIDHGFRLPSARDNRPLNFKEFEERIGQAIFTSATPGNFEREKSQKIVEQIIRPTGLIDPLLEVRPISEKIEVPGKKNAKRGGQVFDFIEEALKAIKKGGRVLTTTLTKKMAEELSEFLKERGVKAEFLHSDIKTMERIEILNDFRRGKFDCLVGVNLLREGLDLPEVTLIGILDADKEGFLRSETSLIQTIGRAARNIDGKVILYADKITDSLKHAIHETERRRQIQTAHNLKNNITPQTIIKKVGESIGQAERERQKAVESLANMDGGIYKGNSKKLIREKEKQMNEAVKSLDFETAAILRDEIKFLLKKKKKTTN